MVVLLGFNLAHNVETLPGEPMEPIVQQSFTLTRIDYDDGLYHSSHSQPQSWHLYLLHLLSFESDTRSM
ncbi:hypothetical protein MtrunA17_Chr7g0230681 [Medicago truncatula]|uniref:Uncharacterized protein n=1 Tax=Medicago truncatula TaxID=3880 RepID=A0A396GY27_MEDTR|nr:hypothetical protein MtrunA17_Chr7g0230681 [Medicago truncatula]